MVPQLSLAELARKFIRQQQRQISPDSSPHKLEKIGPKRQRTVEVKNLTSTLQTCYNTMPTCEPSILTLHGFLDNTHQTKERQILQNKLLPYILQKYVFHHHNDCHANVVPTNSTLSELRVFLNDPSDCGMQHSRSIKNVY